MRDDLPLSTTHEVRDRCLCLHLHRAARSMARRFDEVLRPYGLTHGQYSLMMALNRPDQPKLGEVAQFLAMDRTTMTANIKTLEKRGWVRVVPDPKDRRNRRLTLTDAGRDVLVAAVPAWRDEHDRVDALLETLVGTGDDMRPGLRALAYGQMPEEGGSPSENVR
ncbi:MarR family winged helix-turn-helix transcriptional regulator [Tateyamaria sp. SN3-11]|uniref:MarR family winged helix-turn-helix transcriptional regulator n=1 Tax=Tateyamaria sp. SN3-11 TaxID=3092147 RepID=UPI0039EB531B